MPIKILDRELASQIAAGEVVERPASVVKELVENSLDASSSQISIEVKGGGASLIRVTDNGSGIPTAEVGLAFERHATSKISSISDLQSTNSLGFRGEALPSIAAVAEVDIVTSATGEPTGSYLSIRDGLVTSQTSQGRSRGTTVTVRSLFHSLPARLKFLKSQATEHSHIANVASQYALAFPEVKFTLSIDGRTTLRTAGSGHLLDSVIQVHGLEVAKNMLEISSDRQWPEGVANSSPSVTGMLSSPEVSRSSRRHLSFFVNHRWISSRMLSWALEEAYHGLLMTGKHPVAIVNITLPSEEVDSNIHPRKSEIKFRDESAVFAAVQKAARQALVKLAPVPKIEAVATIYREPEKRRPLLPISAVSHPTAQLPLGSETPAASLPVLRILGQLLTSYIIAEGPRGLYLIDQHAAHERILFEKITQQSQPEIEMQRLLEPAIFEVSPQQDEVLKVHYKDLAEFGFSISPFGARTYLVRTVPALLYEKDWQDMVTKLLDLPSKGKDFLEKLTASMACHSAVRAGQKLSDDEMRELIRQLEKVSLPNTCPHGRPTIIHITSEELKREFHRV